MSARSNTIRRDALTEADVAAAAGSVEFIGAVDDVRPYLASADLVVLPSYREGIPRVAMEASAMAVPVVAYDIRGVREAINPQLGLLVRRGDRAALGDLVESLAQRSPPTGRAGCLEPSVGGVEVF